MASSLWTLKYSLLERLKGPQVDVKVVQLIVPFIHWVGLVSLPLGMGWGVIYRAD